MSEKYFTFMTQQDLVAEFRDWLDAGEKPVVIMGTEYKVSEIIEKCNDVQFEMRWKGWYEKKFELGYVMWRYGVSLFTKEVFVPSKGWIELGVLDNEGGE